jgi:hypothetical protein
MKRREIEEIFRVEDGIIRSAGEFEGQALCMPHFWTRFMDGGADQHVDDSELGCCTVTFEDVIEFPEPTVGQVVRFHEDDKGSVRKL